MATYNVHICLNYVNNMFSIVFNCTNVSMLILYMFSDERTKKKHKATLLFVFSLVLLRPLFIMINITELTSQYNLKIVFLKNVVFFHYSYVHIVFLQTSLKTVFFTFLLRFTVSIASQFNIITLFSFG